MYSFSLKDGFVIDGEPGFVLQPYDQVYVRKSPAYKEQVNVQAVSYTHLDVYKRQGIWRER